MEPEPASTHTSTTCLIEERVRRSGSGLGYNSSGTDQQVYSVCYKWAAAEYIAGRDKKGKQSALSEAGYRSVSDKLLQLASGVYISASTIRRDVSKIQDWRRRSGRGRVACADREVVAVPA